MKKFLSILLVLCMSVSLLSGVTFAASKVASGTCGANLTWELDSDGVLTIVGTGEMEGSVYHGGVPWYSYRESIKKVVISDGVTSIGDTAFANCVALAEIHIPNSVVSIGNGAFCGCSSLPSITIPNSVTSIGWEAFYNCSLLAEITIPNSVKSIGMKAFMECTSLVNATVGDGVESIADYTFDGCTALTSITLGDSVASIGYRGIANCSSLRAVVIPEAVVSIGNLAFYKCGALETLTIGDSVASIGEKAFYMCETLTELTVPGNVVSIGESAFAYCYGLTDVTLGNGVKSIGDYAFNWCTSIADVYYDGTEAEKAEITIKSENDYLTEATWHYAETEGVTWDLTDGVLTISGTGTMEDYYAESAPWYENRYDITSLVIESGVESIGDYAFCGLPALESVSLGSVEEIGEYAFSDCIALAEITIPNSVLETERAVFDGCSWLQEVTVGSGLKRLESSLFANCGMLTKIKLPNTIEVISDHVFYRCSRLRSITLPEGITVIGDGAFQMCKKLVSVNIPSTVQTLGIEVFYYCSELPSISIPKEVEVIGDDSFYHCIALTEINVDAENEFFVSKDGVLYNAEMTELLAYPNASGETLFVVPDGVETINRNAFSYNEYLEEIEIPLTVGVVDGWAFDSCSALDDVYYQGNLLDWENVEILNDNDDFEFARIHFGEYNRPDVTMQTVNGAQIRTTGKQGIRFIASIEKSGDFEDVVEYGIVLIPTADISDISELKIGATFGAHAVAKVEAKKLYAETEDSVTFTAVITDITTRNYERAYSARAYAIMNDGRVRYADAGASRSIYQVAKAGLSGNESAANKEVFQGIVDIVEAAGGGSSSGGGTSSGGAVGGGSSSGSAGGTAGGTASGGGTSSGTAGGELIP